MSDKPGMMRRLLQDKTLTLYVNTGGTNMADKIVTLITE